MKKTFKLFFAIMIVIMTFNISFSQSDSLYIAPRYELSIVNYELVSPTVYEFDMYLRQLTTSRDSTVMLYGTCQYYLKYDTLFKNGGTMTVSIVSSDLAPNLRPTVATPTLNQLRFAANLPSSPSTTDTVRWLTPGTKVARVRLTNSVPFNTGVDIALKWRNKGYGNPYTKITVFTGNDNVTLVDITDSTRHNNMPTGIEPNPVLTSIPNEFNLSQNYPNPFNPTTKIDFAIPVDGKVNMRVYDITGRELVNLVNEVRPAGFYSVNFNGANFASGIYFYRIEVEAQGEKKYEMTKRMVLIK